MVTNCERENKFHYMLLQVRIRKKKTFKMDDQLKLKFRNVLNGG